MSLRSINSEIAAEITRSLEAKITINNGMQRSAARSCGVILSFHSNEYRIWFRQEFSLFYSVVNQRSSFILTVQDCK